MGAVGLDQGAGEDHRAEDQGDGGDQRLAVVGGRARVDRDRAEQKEHQDVDVPTTMPRGSKRAPRVTAGSANHISAGLAAPPVAITASASSSGRVPQAAGNPEGGVLAHAA